MLRRRNSGALPPRTMRTRLMAYMSTDAQNTGSPNHGCANQHNLAAMISNPADLLGPRTEGSRYGERRDDVMNKYAKGKVTGADKSEDERVRVKGAN